MTLENLLNWLIWRIPRGKSGVKNVMVRSNNLVLFFDHSKSDMQVFSLRELVSIESGLRQFVCWLDKNYLPFCSKCNIKIESNNDKIKSDIFYEEEVNYRLMLSSIQEDIENFLLTNITLPWQEK